MAIDGAAMAGAAVASTSAVLIAAMRKWNRKCIESRVTRPRMCRAVKVDLSIPIERAPFRSESPGEPSCLRPPRGRDVTAGVNDVAPFYDLGPTNGGRSKDRSGCAARYRVASRAP